MELALIAGSVGGLKLMPEIFGELMLGATPHQLALRLTLMPDIFSGLSWVLPNIAPVSIQAHADA